MKNLINKVRHHGKKITIHLKRHHRKYLFGALCSGILALIAVHTASTINSIFANEEPVAPSIIYDSGANITYVDTEGREFTGIGTITISNGVDSITMLDRNLGATTDDINETGSYGYHFQWGNNYGFDPFDESVEDNAVSGETVDTSEYGPGHYYADGIFRSITEDPYDWSDPKNDNLWGGSGDDEENNRGLNSNIEITNRQGPCPDGYHVPTQGERGKVLTYRSQYYTGAGNELVLSGDYPLQYFEDGTAKNQFINDFKIPLAGYRNSRFLNVNTEFDSALLWSSSPSNSKSRYFVISYGVFSNYSSSRVEGLSLRCFKDYKDETPPNCRVEFRPIDVKIPSSTSGFFNATIAYITGCSEEIYQIDENMPLTYIYNHDGNHQFWFSDSAGNIGKRRLNLRVSEDGINSQATNLSSISHIVKDNVVTVSWETTDSGWLEVLLWDEDDTEFKFLQGVELDSKIFSFPINRVGTFSLRFVPNSNTGASIDYSIDVMSLSTGFTTLTPVNIPSCSVTYSSTSTTNSGVIAYLYGCNEEISGNELSYTFHENGYFPFVYKNSLNNYWYNIAVVDWIDKDAPTCNVAYDVTGTTTGNVVASLTGCSETITGTNLQHTFTGNGTYTFEFQDLAGNTGSTGAEVTWINNNPTCNIEYSTTGFTNKPVIAYLTGCNRVITGTDLQYTFTGNGEYTFEFQDLLGNTGSTRAIVTWITDNTTYINVEGDEFRWDNLTICNPDNSGECITMMDRNLGATTNDITKTGSYGYKYQWGNNYGFKDGCWQTTGCSDDITSGALSLYTDGIEWRSIYNNSGYYGKVFIKGGLNTYWSDYKVHNYLWGGGDDNSGSNWGYPISNPTDRQGPCPDGYHVPSAGERSNVVGRWIEKSNTGLRAQGYKDTVSSSRFLNWISDHSGSYAFLVDFKIPLAGARDYYSGKLGEFGEDTYLWTSTAPGNESAVFAYHLDGKNNVESWNHYSSSNALSVRCFKNNSGNNSVDTGISFSISVDDNISAGKYVDFTVKVIKDGVTYKNYTDKIMIVLTDKRGNLIDDSLYDVYNDGIYEFTQSDRGRKTFKNGLKIKKAGTYKLEVFDLDDHEGSEIIVVGGSRNAANFEYDTLKFNPNYSDEMNEAYQFSRYFDITTKDNIKDAHIYSGLNRIAMAKMLANYAENVLGIDDFDTSRNCKFVDVPTSLDKSYDYGVTRACQLGIMGVNMRNNKFNPSGGVTRAQFATALSRLLFETKDGTDKYYSTHLTKLKNEGIITNVNPSLQELRGYVMLMLKRAAEQ